MALRPESAAYLLSAANMKMKLGAQTPASSTFEAAAMLYRRAAALPSASVAQAQAAADKAAAAEQDRQPA